MPNEIRESTNDCSANVAMHNLINKRCRGQSIYYSRDFCPELTAQSRLLSFVPGPQQCPVLLRDVLELRKSTGQPFEAGLSFRPGRLIVRMRFHVRQSRIEQRSFPVSHWTSSGESVSQTLSISSRRSAGLRPETLARSDSSIMVERISERSIQANLFR